MIRDNGCSRASRVLGHESSCLLCPFEECTLDEHTLEHKSYKYPPITIEIDKLLANIFLYSLTCKELEVLMYLAGGYDPIQIAGELGRSWYTVKHHACSVYRKLGRCYKFEGLNHTMNAVMCYIAVKGVPELSRQTSF